ncbi:MAG: AMP-binding protein [Desulfobacteraceae bacterium]|nr:AMP-binding protein [Desulfobacteraceae bacterium]
MNIVKFISYLRSLDINIWADKDHLCYSGPEKSLSPDLLTDLSKRKTEILMFLHQTESAFYIDSSPIGSVSREKNLSLSYSQQRLWFLKQLRPEIYAYNIPTAKHLSGPLDINVLEQSLGEIIRRHESLRTTFTTVDGHPVQIIADASDKYRLTVINSESSKVREMITSEAWRPFDLKKGPLVRITLFRLNDTEYILLSNFHHIIFDGWSLDIFYRELTMLYTAYLRGDTPPLPDLPVQFVEFVEWEKQRFREPGNRGMAYWREKLRGELPVLQLPFDHSRPAIHSFQGASCSFVLSGPLTDALKRLSLQQNATLFMTLLAAFKTLLWRYTMEDDILVAVPMTIRNRSEIENLIGFFVNIPVLRTDLSGNPEFENLLARIRVVTLEAHTFRDTPFGKLVEELRFERDPSQQPPFKVMFALQSLPLEPTLPGITATPVKIESKIAKFDLKLEITENKQGLDGFFEYSTDLFDADTISRTAKHFQMLLEGIVTDPGRRLSDLPLLTEAERYQLLVEWNDTQTGYLRDRCLHQLFEAQLEQTPEAVAAIFPESCSYPETTLINEYGPTETEIGFCAYEVSEETSLSDSIPIGRPIANTKLYILDHYLQPVPVGVPGELYIGGEGLERGYFKRSGLTAEKFVLNPFNTEERLYKTGNRVRYLANGKIELLGSINNIHQKEKP